MSRVSDRADTMAAHYRRQIEGANAEIARLRVENSAKDAQIDRMWTTHNQLWQDHQELHLELTRLHAAVEDDTLP